MKILYLLWECCGNSEMIQAMRVAGHDVAALQTSQDGLLSPEIADKVKKAAGENGCDIVYGFNYFPHVAEAAKDIGIGYYAWVYDNPCVQLYSYTVTYPTNHIFVFDSDTYLKFHSEGINTIDFLPMAADPDRVEQLCREARPGYEADISFVGSLYNERHDFYHRMIDKGLPDRTYGYIRGIIEAQKHIYGMDLSEHLLTDEILEDLHAALPLGPSAGSVITTRTLFSQYVIDRQVTVEERHHILTALGAVFGERYRVDLYTHDASAAFAGVTNHGPADQFREAPLIFNRSRIDLNISLRSIVNGIPLRCFEIMGAGGFLLTSYAGDMLRFFNDGEHFVSFESTDDMLGKCAYYLEHEDEREAIARAGLAAIRENHTYYHRVLEMFD